MAKLQRPTKQIHKNTTAVQRLHKKRRQETWNPNDLYEQNGFDNSICIAHFELQIFLRGETSRGKKQQPTIEFRVA